MFIYTYCICYPHTADFLDEEFGYDRHTPLGKNPKEWQRGYIGLPSQRKTSNCDVTVKNRPQQGREADGANSSFYDTENSGSVTLKG